MADDTQPSEDKRKAIADCLEEVRRISLADPNARLSAEVTLKVMLALSVLSTENEKLRTMVSIMWPYYWGPDYVNVRKQAAKAVEL